MSKQKSRLTIETLEDRITPSTGMPWANHNLTLSFVPTGTSVDGYQNSLSDTLGGSAATQDWQAEILRAANDWAAAAGVSITLVPDDGSPLNAPGLIQGDSRFGDIRVAAEPMGVNGQLSIGSPYNPLAGTRSGDIVFNSSIAWSVGSGNDIYTAALHELGNSLGVSENSDPTSAMDHTYHGVQAGLSLADIAAVQSLYSGSLTTNAPATAQNILSGALSTTLATNTYAVQSLEAQYYHFQLSVDNTNGAANGVSVSMQLIDASGNVLCTLVSQDGQTVTTNIQLVGAIYTTTFTGATISGLVPSINYSFAGIGLSHPLDPIPVNPTDPTLGGGPITPPPPPGSTSTDPPTLVVVPTAPPTEPTSPPPPTTPPDATTPPTTPPPTAPDATSPTSAPPPSMP